jgi:hypothetical protein
LRFAIFRVVPHSSDGRPHDPHDLPLDTILELVLSKLVP